MREGSVEAPTRHPIEWKTDDFWNRDSLNNELARVYDVCHGCRRCVSLCDSFPTMFDLIDESETLEDAGVAVEEYGKVVHQKKLTMWNYLFFTICRYKLIAFLNSILFKKIRFVNSFWHLILH